MSLVAMSETPVAKGLLNKRGEYVAIEGPSACGKSTLLSILGLLDTPTARRYRLNGHAVEKLNLSERAAIRNREIGSIFQNFNVIGDLSIYENVELPLVYRGMAKGEPRARVEDVLERVHMSHRAKHYPMQLSGGEQQRVAVARPLAGDPSLLLADEPAGNLDRRNGEAVRLAELHQYAQRSSWLRMMPALRATQIARSAYSTANSSTNA